MSCGINSGCKMLISVQQCMRNALNIDKKIFPCRKLNALKKVFRPVSLVRFSHHSIKGKTVRFEQYGSNILLKKNQFAVPLAGNSYSKYSNKPTGEKKQNETNSEVKLSLYQKFKRMYKEYWYVLVPVHIITSCFWFGSFYYLAASGIDIPMLLENLGAPESWIENLKNSKAGNVVLAYTLYKVATPLRYTVTLGGTTLSINYLKQWGWIKPVPNKEQIKKLYQEQKGVLKDLKASYKDKMQVTKTEFLKTKHEIQKQLEVAKEEFHKTMKETREDLKEGVKGGTEEWKIISKSFVRDLKERLGNFKKRQND